MSNVQFGSFGQAARTLDVVAEQKLSTQEVEVLNNGYLTDLVRAIRVGTVPARDVFQKFLGLLPEFKVWKRIKLGLHKTTEAYEKALESSGFRIHSYAYKILKKVSVSQTEIELDLVVVTPVGLGLKNPTHQQICDRAEKLGLEKCPREVGPALRLAYQDQPNDEWLLVAMEPEADSGGSLDVFDVGRGDDELWLDARWFYPRHTWRGDDQFVFVLPRK